MEKLDLLKDEAFVKCFSIASYAKKFYVRVDSQIEVVVLYVNNSIEWKESICFNDVAEISVVHDFFEKRYMRNDSLVCRFYRLLINAIDAGFKKFEFVL